MKKVIICVLGHDRPGILAATTQVLYQQDCNLENVSQTILQSEFAGFFIATIPEGLNEEALNCQLEKALNPMSLNVYTKLIREDIPVYQTPVSEPFIITTKGPDRKGLVAGITEVIAKYCVNVTNLQAVFMGGDDPSRNIMIYEVDIPNAINYQSFEWDLRQRAAYLGLKISIQHRNIFEVLNRI